MLQQIRTLFVWCVIGALTIQLSMAAYWLLLQPAPYVPQVDVPTLHDYSDYLSGKLTSMHDVFRQGDVMYVHRAYCYGGKSDGIARREFVNGLVWTLPSVATSVSPGCHSSYFPVAVPADLPVGQYLFRVTLLFNTNPLRTDVVRLRDIRVTILPMKKG